MLRRRRAEAPRDPAHEEAVALLAHGGWELDDAQAHHRANPDTFWLPPAEQLAQLRPGTAVRAMLRLADLADTALEGRGPLDAQGRPELVVRTERMWFWVEARDGEALSCVLQNVPLASHTVLEPGSRIALDVNDVIDLQLEPPVDMPDELVALAELGLGTAPATGPVALDRTRRVSTAQQQVCDDAGVAPQLPVVVDFVRVLLAESVLGDDTAWPVYGIREEPRHDRGSCGWVLWTRESAFEVAQASEDFQVAGFASLNKTRVWPMLALPPGWGFVLLPDGPPDVFRL